MSLVKKNIAERKRTKARESLLATLSHLDDALTLQMIWAINALQSEEPPDLRRYLRYPREAAEARVGDQHFALKWEMENLLLLLLSTPKKPVNFLRAPNYNSYNTVAGVMNEVKRAEQAESSALVNSKNILDELQRIAHKQFLWQRDFYQSERFYRYVYVYGQGKCAEYFETKNGLSVSEFVLMCIGLYSTGRSFGWQKRPWIEPPLTLRPEIVDLTLKLISKELPDMRVDTKKRIDQIAGQNKAKVAYLPSSLRHFPIITSAKHSNQFIAPLPQLLAFRAPYGLYYDLADGPQTLLEEANNRFEEYGKKLLKARCPRFEVLRDQKYGTKAKTYRTPDLLLKDGESIKAVFECKATKLTFAAQYGEDQYAEAPKAFGQIAKGMSQLWKFFSRARRGVYTNELVAPDAHGIILTMENWFQIDRRQLPNLRAAAEELCADEPDMLPEDKRDVIFCSIESLDDVLACSTEDELLETFAKSRQPEHTGWMLSDVRNPYGKEVLERRDYPFEIEDVLPLWGEMIK